MLVPATASGRTPGSPPLLDECQHAVGGGIGSRNALVAGARNRLIPWWNTEGRAAVRNFARGAKKFIDELAIDGEGTGHATKETGDTHLRDRLRGRRRGRGRRRRNGIWRRSRWHGLEGEGNVVVAPRRISDAGSTIEVCRQVGAVSDAAAADLTAAGVAEAKRIARIVPGIDITQRGSAPIGRPAAGATVPARSGFIVRLDRAGGDQQAEDRDERD